MGSFRTLREALESICRTIRDAAWRDLKGSLGSA
jgi:hypothetical protein